MVEHERAGERFRLPLDFASSGDPVEGNPYQVGDLRHRVWADETRKAEENVSRLKSAALLNGSASDELGFMRLVGARFNEWARRGVCVAWDEPAVESYNAWLVSYANGWLELLAANGAPETTLGPLKTLLGGLVQAWKAEAHAFASRLRCAPEPEEAFVAPETVSPTVVSRRKRELATHRHREGLTAADFARRVGISETAIRGIANEDRTRFAEDTRDRLLKALGTSVRDWYSS